MLQSRLFDITMQQIYIFLKAAEYENFSKVATELHVTQPTISRNISALEISLGLILFIRAKQRVRLTPAGSILYSGWSKSLDNLTDAYDKAFVVQGGQINQLSIVDNNSSYASAYLLPIISIFEQKHSNVHLNIERTNLIEAAEGMLSGKYDVGFFINVDREFFENTQMECIDLFSTEPAIIIPEKHPLFKKVKITAKDLEDQTYVVAKSVDNSYIKQLNKICAEHGFRPSNLVEVPNPQTIILELAKGNALSIMDSEFKVDGEFQYRNIILSGGKEKFGFILVHPIGSDNKNIAKFKKAAVDFSAKKQDLLKSTYRDRSGRTVFLSPEK